MPARLNPIRKALLKKGLMDPKKSVIQAQKDAGYSDSYAHNSTCNGGVKICMSEIAQEISFKDLTPEHFTKKSNLIFEKALSLKKPDLTNAMRATEFQGRISGIDRQSPSTIVNISDADNVNIIADTDGLTRLARGRQ